MILAGLYFKYGCGPLRVRTKEAQNQDAPKDYSKVMVWYEMKNGTVGQDWLETVEEWAKGNTKYCFESTWPINQK